MKLDPSRRADGAQSRRAARAVHQAAAALRRQPPAADEGGRLPGREARAWSTCPSPEPGQGPGRARGRRAAGSAAPTCTPATTPTQQAEVLVEAGYDGFMRSHQPVVFGHEFCGDVAEYGPGHREEDHRPARRWWRCRFVRAATTCTRSACRPRAPGAYAERVVVEESLMIAVPNGLSPELAALTEPMAVGRHAVQRAEIKKGDVAIVIGCGPVGLAVICMLKAQGVANGRGERLLARPARARYRVRRRRGRRPGEDSPYEAAGERGLPDDGRRRCSSSRVERDGEAAQPAAAVASRVRVAPRRSAHHAEAPGHLRMRRRSRHHRQDHPERAALLARRGRRRLHGRRTRSARRWRSTRRSTCASSRLHAARVPRHLRMLADGKVDAAPLVTGTVGLEASTALSTRSATPEKHAKILIDPKSAISEPSAL